MNKMKTHHNTCRCHFYHRNALVNCTKLKTKKTYRLTIYNYYVDNFSRGRMKKKTYSPVYQFA